VSWRHWICDARDGRVICPVDIPSFSWDMTIGDFSLATTGPADKGAGSGDESGLTLPWSALPARSPAERSLLVDPTRRALCTAWVGSDDPGDLGDPLLWGVIGDREDHQLDTTFGLTSPMALLADRYVIRDGAYQDGRSVDVIGMEGLSYRGIQSEIGAWATSRKQGGMLPIDWTYLGERGNHQKTEYKAWNAQNVSARKLIEDISNLQGGPDCDFEPYWADGQHVRCRFVAGSDADVYLHEDAAPVHLSCFPGGGDLEDVSVAHASPIHRWYATGAGSDESVLTALAEDLGPVTSGMDPPILREAVYSDTDTDNLDVLRRHARSRLEGGRRKLIQVSGTVHFNDRDQAGNPLRTPSGLRPGRRCVLHLQGFPTLPDGDYGTRVMRLSGDQSDKGQVVLDVMADPFQ
jgi:hypothetical protein